MKNKQVKQMMVDVTLKGRKLYWFGGGREKFLAKSIEDVAVLLADYIGEHRVKKILNDGLFGEIKMSHADWFKLNCWDVDLMMSVPTISVVQGDGIFLV